MQFWDLTQLLHVAMRKMSEIKPHCASLIPRFWPTPTITSLTVHYIRTWFWWPGTPLLILQIWTCGTRSQITTCSLHMFSIVRETQTSHFTFFILNSYGSFGTLSRRTPRRRSSPTHRLLASSESCSWCPCAVRCTCTSTCHPSGRRSCATTTSCTTMRPARWAPTTRCSMRSSWCSAWTREPRPTCAARARWFCRGSMPRAAPHPAPRSHAPEQGPPRNNVQ